MSRGLRPKKELSMKLDTKFRGKWYAEEDIVEKLEDALQLKGVKLDDDRDVDTLIELAYANDISL